MRTQGRWADLAEPELRLSPTAISMLSGQKAFGLLEGRGVAVVAAAADAAAAAGGKSSC